MSFFYNSQTPVQKATRNKKIPVNVLHKAGCTACPLNRIKKLNSPKMKPSGVKNPSIYLLGGAVLPEDDKENIQFASDFGDRILKEFPEDWIDKELRFNNVLNCLCESQNKMDTAMECCRSRIEDDIADSQPDVIVGVGSQALRWAVGSGDVSKWRGRLVPIKVKNHICWFMPIYDGYFLFNRQRFTTKGKPKTNEYDHITTHDIERLLEMIETETLPKPFIEDPAKYYQNLNIITGENDEDDFKQLEKLLADLETESKVGFDYETTSLRPYNDDSDLLSVSISNYKTTVAFPLNHPDGWKTAQLRKKANKLLEDFIYNSGIKICHNLKFEQEWTGEFYGEDLLHGAKWDDTMAQGYTLDNRKGMLSLGVLTRLHLGFNLKELTGVQAKNWRDYPLKDYLEYNALDAKYTYLLDEKQGGLLRQIKSLSWVHKHLIKASATLALSQLHGIIPNKRNISKFSKSLGDEIKEIEFSINKLPEVKEYKKKYKTFNPLSSDQLLILLQEFYGLSEELRNGKGKYSTDEPVLSTIKLPIAKKILNIRGRVKLKSTYVDSMKGHTYDDGVIHPEFNLYWTSTGRLSCEAPNMQNFPKRKDKWVRGVIGTPRDYTFVASDYGQLEARIIAASSHDKNFCDAIWDDYDIHMDWAQRIATDIPSIIGGRKFLNDKDIMKELRQKVKNKWVFPAFFGASMYSIAGYLRVDPDKLKPVFRSFWKEYAGVKEWQELVIADYNKKGYIESLTGRRRQGPIGYNEIINTGIQGASSDIVMNAMNKLSEMGYQARLNIHDDLSFYLHNDVLDEDIQTISEVMCTTPMNDFDFVTVPMSVEIETGKDWANLKEYKVFTSKDFGFTRN